MRRRIGRIWRRKSVGRDGGWEKAFISLGKRVASVGGEDATGWPW